MAVQTKNVVLLARVDDPVTGATLATFSTIQPVQHEDEDSAPALIAESALELAADVGGWTRY
jgi:hypothetical protein